MRPRFLSAVSRQHVRLVGGSGSTQRFRAAKSRARLSGKAVLRVDMSAIVSKYIGETERNIRRLLESAERRDAMLYFDEADALFGDRSEAAAGEARLAKARTYLLSHARRQHITVICGKPAQQRTHTQPLLTDGEDGENGEADELDEPGE